MNKAILTLLTCLSCSSLNAEFMDDTWRLKSFIYEMRDVAVQERDEIVEDFNRINFYYFDGKIQAYDEILLWIDLNDNHFSID